MAKRIKVIRGDDFESMPYIEQEQDGEAGGGTAAFAVGDLSSALKMGFSGGVAETGDRSGKFDAVITEEHSDDLLSDGLVSLAHLARKHLLKPSGVFYPRAAMVYAAIASIRTTKIEGFDVRPWNVFRNFPGEVVYDFEEVMLNEPGCGTLLSRPVPILGIDLNNPPEIAALDSAMSERFKVRATAEGLFNVIVTWHELDMGDDAGTLSFAPDMQNPRHMYSRGVKQRLFFVGYEQRVAVHDVVTFERVHDSTSYRVLAVPDAKAEKAGRLVRWPEANVLSYHFPMIMEKPRNVRFERALLRAIRAYRREHGVGPHVLDIGSGTGLLAMMAARGGARKVTSGLCARRLARHPQRPRPAAQQAYGGHGAPPRAS